jgi:hypothetical protein
MKKVLVTTVCALVSVGAFGQGQLYMSNSNSIFDNVGKPLGSAAGNDISVELLAGVNPASLAPIPSSICYVNQGYFYGPGTGIVTLSGLPAGTTIAYAVEVWSTSAGSYANAQRGPGALWCESSVNTYILGGYNPVAGSPPVAPSPLNFATFDATLLVAVPEPATFALGFMARALFCCFVGVIRSTRFSAWRVRRLPAARAAKCGIRLPNRGGWGQMAG